MIHPASDKVNALSIVCQEAMVQGTPVALADNGDGRLRATIAAAAGDFTFGTMLAYFITPDSEDVEFTGEPQSTNFNLNTDVGVGGGTQVIASGTECVALGGAGVALVRMDRHSVYNTPANLTAFTPGTILKAHTDGLLALDADDDIDVEAAKVVANDGVTIVVLLA